MRRSPVRKMPLVRRRGQDTSAPDADALRRGLAASSPAQRVWLAQVVLGAGVLAASSPVELAVPVVRFAARGRGVQTGAALGSLLSFLLTHAYGTLIRHQLDADEMSGDEHDDDPAYDRWMTRVVFSGAVVLPVAGALLPVTVIGRTRSPLWGLGLWLAVRLAAVTVLVADASRLRGRRDREETTAEPVGH